MSIEFSYVPATAERGEANVAAIAFDATATGRHLALAERAGFERVIVDDPGGTLANLDIACHTARSSSTLQIALTHWAGAIAPVAAARQLAAFDTSTGGRLTLRILAQGRDRPDDREAWHPSHAASLQRTDEYLMLLKRLWLSPQPFDFEGAYHSFRDGFVPDKGLRPGEMPLRMNGSSGTAIQVAARHADVFELLPGSYENVRQQIERVRNAAAPYGRSRKICFALPVDLSDGSPTTQAHAEADKLKGLSVGTVESFLRYVEAGVSEFMVSGIQDGNAMRSFSERVASVVRKNAEQATAELSGWPSISSHRRAARHSPLAI